MRTVSESTLLSVNIVKIISNRFPSLWYTNVWARLKRLSVSRCPDREECEKPMWFPQSSPLCYPLHCFMPYLKTPFSKFGHIFMHTWSHFMLPHFIDALHYLHTSMLMSTLYITILYYHTHNHPKTTWTPDPKRFDWRKHSRINTFITSLKDNLGTSEWEPLYHCHWGAI